MEEELPQGSKVSLFDAPPPQEEEIVLEADDDDPEPPPADPAYQEGIWNGAILLDDVQAVANAIQSALGAAALRAMTPGAEPVDMTREMVMTAVATTASVIRSKYVATALTTLGAVVRAHRDPSDENVLVAKRALDAFCV